jgi:peptide/nickel transport system permease protein
MAVVGICVLAIILLIAVFAPVVAPYDPLTQDLTNILAPPAWSEGGSLVHPLGTDGLGRDVASRLVFGARNSLIISFSAMLIASILGLVTGLIAGFYGRWVDSLIMRFGDIQLAFPFILLAIIILGLARDRSSLHLILVLGIPAWIVYARVVRSRVIAEREKDYVTGAKAIGAGSVRRMVKYVLPSVWQVVPVIALLDLGFIVIVESTLSFLGFGLTPPTPSWGSILADGRENMVISFWLPVLPGLAITLTVLSINLIADGLAEVLDPRLSRGTFRRLVLRKRVRDHDAPAEEPAPLLSVRDLHVEFPVGNGVVRAVRGVSFDLHRGQTLGIVGESGSGKSVTALSIIQLLDSPGRVTQGEIRFDGRDVARIDDREMAALRGRKIGMIFQNPGASLNPVLTIGFQMTETIGRHLGRSGDEAVGIAKESLRSVGIGDPGGVLRRYPFQLSGGMNQRVMIAMAMLGRPDLLMADEPTSALDVTTQAQILEQLTDITRDHGTSLILITHDIALVAEYSDFVMVMYAGQLSEFGPAEEVVHNPKHPYTRALLDSVPRAELTADMRLQAIPGELPDPAAVPPGCPFTARCPYVMDVCHEVNPPPFEIDGSRATCHLWSPQRAEAAAE